ncbi:hypothetical protein [Magnetospirillum sulfuroxidans]|uniref:Uncharacterized protein n=1 Tax=Magnetospirillum sulfuroxidans TaxID=611300 RepID=A0ABS5IFW0_9PROT|nr:hypothetical protein [Magnetospirillum sulfuroxidans]
MKLKKGKGVALAPVELAGNFTRGLVATALLTAVQDRWSHGKPPGKKVLRMALQGGAALAAGIATAESLRRRDYASALIALAGGAAGIAAAEILLNPDPIPPAPETEIG